jgi:hypothetical protein
LTTSKILAWQPVIKWRLKDGWCIQGRDIVKGATPSEGNITAVLQKCARKILGRRGLHVWASY